MYPLHLLLCTGGLSATEASGAGIAVAKERAERLGYGSEFLEELKRSGSLKKMVDANGLRGVEVTMSR
jgi:hypothetical protein